MPYIPLVTHRHLTLCSPGSQDLDKHVTPGRGRCGRGEERRAEERRNNQLILKIFYRLSLVPLIFKYSNDVLKCFAM